MEWVETTGRTIEEALDAALDQLGVDESDAEYEVVEEPKVGLFGRTRGEARVRARVRPTRPRPKEERRDRKRRAARPDKGEGPEKSTGSAAAADAPQEEQESRVSETGVDVPIADQAEVAAEFLRGVLDRFGMEATVAIREVDEDTVEVAVDGDELGLLIGPKGATLSALQDLARTVVQRRTSARNGRLLVDVSGYRQRRREALERFAETAAQQVLASGSRAVLEPMSAADRKVLHDKINSIDGVVTASEGEEPRRRVVILPDPAS